MKQSMSSLKSFYEKLVTFFEVGKGVYLLPLPALVFIALFVLYPLVWNVFISFTNYSPIGYHAKHYWFVGLRNYINLLTDETFQASLWNSFIFTVLSAIIGQAFLGLSLALVARAKLPEGPIGGVLKVLRAIAIGLVYAAWVIPEVVAGYAWAAITDRGGLLTLLLGLNVRLYEVRPLETIIVANIWRGTAFSMILFMAALEGIPSYIYEAAEVDGTTAWQKFRYIILPLIAPALLVDFILITIWTFGVFTLPFIMLREMPSILWTLYVYTYGITIFEPTIAAAASDIMFVIVLVLIVAYLKLLGRLQRVM